MVILNYKDPQLSRIQVSDLNLNLIIEHLLPQFLKNAVPVSSSHRVNKTKHKLDLELTSSIYKLCNLGKLLNFSELSFRVVMIVSEPAPEPFKRLRLCDAVRVIWVPK